jgi:hypothetical protein
VGLNSLVLFFFFLDVINIIYLISYYALNFSLHFTIQGGKVSYFCFFLIVQGEGVRLYLFILIFLIVEEPVNQILWHLQNTLFVHSRKFTRLPKLMDGKEGQHNVNTTCQTTKNQCRYGATSFII